MDKKELEAQLPLHIPVIARIVDDAGGSYCFGLSQSTRAAVNLTLRNVPESVIDSVLEAGFQPLSLVSAGEYVWWLSQAK